MEYNVVSVKQCYETTAKITCSKTVFSPTGQLIKHCFVFARAKVVVNFLSRLRNYEFYHLSRLACVLYQSDADQRSL